MGRVNGETFYHGRVYLEEGFSTGSALRQSENVDLEELKRKYPQVKTVRGRYDIWDFSELGIDFSHDGDPD